MTQEPMNLPSLQANFNIHFQEFTKTLNGERNTPLYELRKAAAEQLASLAFPTTKHEEWKYTNLKNILSTPFGVTNVPRIEKAKEKLQSIAPAQGNRLVFVNGQLIPELSTIVKEVPFTIGNLSSHYESHSQLIDTYFGKLADTKEQPFLALNSALYQKAVFVHIPKNCIVDHPIECVFVHDATEQAILTLPRLFAVIEQGGNCAFTDRHLIIGTHEVFTNVVNEIIVAANAQCTHSQLQDVADNVSIINNTKVLQEANSVYTNNTVSLAAKLIRNNLDIVLDGSNSEANMNGLYMIKDKTHVDNHTSVNHRQPHTNSNELYKGIVDGAATGVFNGKIFVQQLAQKTNAFQSNNNILLSEKATVDTKPQLEIWADDVKCSHGATIGSLDEEPLFYLQSRGIPESKARALLLEAFAFDITQRITDDVIRQEVEQTIEKRFA